MTLPEAARLARQIALGAPFWAPPRVQIKIDHLADELTRITKPKLEDPDSEETLS